MNKFLIFIVLLAGVLRFAFIDNLPPSLTWDEVAWGYNSYSLGLDAKDEFGKLLPITYLESFGDFKPPIYAYLGILPVKFFGLNEFSTRFPSAFFGTLSVLVTYFLVKELFGKEKEKLALLSSLLLAISPWHIMLSRAAFEANVAHFFVILGLVLFFYALRKKTYFLILSTLSFVLSMYTFNSARIVVPILVVFLVAAFHKKLLKNIKISTASLLFGFLLFLPLLLFLNTPQAKLRFNEVNIFSDPEIVSLSNQQVANDGNSGFSKIIHNRRFGYVVSYLRHYIDNITPNFLFIKGDGNPKFSIQDVGQLYIWEIPFLVAGILLLFRKRERFWYLVPFMIFIAIIPAGFARETPHALRIENSLPMVQIVVAYGLISFISYFSKRKQIYISSLMGLIIAFGVIYFLHNYLTHYAREFSGEWQYGYKESVEYVLKVQDFYQTIYITEELGRPYIYYLFYSKYDPRQFRKEADIYREALGFVHINGYSNLKFSEDISNIVQKNSLYISTPDEKPEGAKVLKEFKLLNGKIALVAYTL